MEAPVRGLGERAQDHGGGRTCSEGVEGLRVGRLDMQMCVRTRSIRLVPVPSSPENGRRPVAISNSTMPRL